jgi:uncharacterized protein with PIN domain
MGLFKTKEPQTVQIAGNELKCPICNNNLFRRRRAQMNSAIATFFKLDWTNRSATCYVCSKCTHISWFLE